MATVETESALSRARIAGEWLMNNGQLRNGQSLIDAVDRAIAAEKVAETNRLDRFGKDHSVRHRPGTHRRWELEPTKEEIDRAFRELKALRGAAEMVLDWWHEWYDGEPGPEETVAFEALSAASGAPG